MASKQTAGNFHSGTIHGVTWKAWRLPADNSLFMLMGASLCSIRRGTISIVTDSFNHAVAERNLSPIDNSDLERIYQHVKKAGKLHATKRTGT